LSVWSLMCTMPVRSRAGLHLVAGPLSDAAPDGAAMPGDPAAAALRLRILDYVSPSAARRELTAQPGRLP